MKKYLIIALLLSSMSYAQISTKYLLIGWTDQLPTSRQRELETNLNAYLKNTDTNAVSISRVLYSNTVTHVVMEIGCIDRAMIKDDVTDEDIDTMVKRIPKPFVDKCVKVLTDSPYYWLEGNNWIAIDRTPQ